MRHAARRPHISERFPPKDVPPSCPASPTMPGLKFPSPTALSTGFGRTDPPQGPWEARAAGSLSDLGPSRLLGPPGSHSGLPSVSLASGQHLDPWKGSMHPHAQLPCLQNTHADATQTSDPALASRAPSVPGHGPCPCGRPWQRAPRPSRRRVRAQDGEGPRCQLRRADGRPHTAPCVYTTLTGSSPMRRVEWATPGATYTAVPALSGRTSSSSLISPTPLTTKSAS